jgi:integrase
MPDQPPSRKLVRTSTPGVYKRGGRYVVRYLDPQGRQRQRAARTLADARALKAALTADVARGEHRELSRVAFVDYGAEWARTYTGRTGSGIRPETLHEYRRDLELFAVPYFGRRRLSEIEPRDVKAFALHLADEKKLAPASVRNVVAPLRALLATAVEEGLIRHNPAAGLRLPSRRTSPGEGEVEERAKALTPDELRRLIAEIPEGWQRLIVQFVAVTGLRISETIALRWKNIDLDRGRVLVRSRIYQGRLDAPKSKFGRRDVPISAGMVGALRRHRLGSRYSLDEHPVFATLRGTAFRPENLLRRVLKPAARRAGVGWVGWHTLRHTCASTLFTGGSNAKQVQVWLGHHSPGFHARDVRASAAR